MAVTEQDVVLQDGETSAEAAESVRAEFGLATAEVVQENGPGGGWPVIRFSGTPEAIARFEATF